MHVHNKDWLAKENSTDAETPFGFSANRPDINSVKRMAGYVGDAREENMSYMRDGATLIFLGTDTWKTRNFLLDKETH